MPVVTTLSPSLSPAQAALHDDPAMRAIRVLRTAKAEIKELEAKFLDAAAAAREITNSLEDEIGKLREGLFEEQRHG